MTGAANNRPLIHVTAAIDVGKTRTRRPSQRHRLRHRQRRWNVNVSSPSYLLSA